MTGMSFEERLALLVDREATAVVSANHVGTKELNTGDYSSAGLVVPRNKRDHRESDR